MFVSNKSSKTTIGCVALGPDVYLYSNLDIDNLIRHGRTDNRDFHHHHLDGHPFSTNWYTAAFAIRVYTLDSTTVNESSNGMFTYAMYYSYTEVHRPQVLNSSASLYCYRSSIWLSHFNSQNSLLSRMWTNAPKWPKKWA